MGHPVIIAIGTERYLLDQPENLAMVSASCKSTFGYKVITAAYTLQ
jgi:hypothetical protein